jgi:four helix bundle protein
MKRTQFDHEKLNIYQMGIGFVAWLEEWMPSITTNVSACNHLARASGGVPVNIAEASGKRSMKERRQFIDTAYGSSLECAACLDILGILNCLSSLRVHEGKERLSTLVSLLVGFRKSTSHMVREEGVPYVTARDPVQRIWFDHERLDVYCKALDFTAWCGQASKNTGGPRSVAKSLDKASTGVVLNIAEGNGKFSSKDRCRFIDHARTAALQAAAILDVISLRQEKDAAFFGAGKSILVDIVRMLVAWQRSIAER